MALEGKSFSAFGKDLVIKGDCYHLLDNFREKIVDLIVTDPPYILNTSDTKFKGAKIYGSKKLHEICNGYNVDLFLGLCAKVCKKMNCFVFCSNAQIPEIMQWALNKGFYATLLAWHKSNAIPFCHSSWKPDLEFIIHIREVGACFNGSSRIASKLYSSCTNPSQYGHPTEKPIGLLGKLIQTASNEGILYLILLQEVGQL